MEPFHLMYHLSCSKGVLPSRYDDRGYSKYKLHEQNLVFQISGDNDIYRQQTMYNDG